MPQIVSPLTAIPIGTTVLKLIQSFCREYALPVPNAIAGSTDGGSLQMRELLQAVGEDCWLASNWQACLRTISFISQEGMDQGDIRILCPDNFSHIIPQTFWNSSSRRRIDGPLTDFDWQQLSVYNSAGNQFAFYISGNRLQMSSTTKANQGLTLIYKSRNWLYQDGVNLGNEYKSDVDTCIFSNVLMKRGLNAFWLRSKQMPHRLEMEMFENSKAQEASQDVVKNVIQLDGGIGLRPAGITIPIGNWTR